MFANIPFTKTSTVVLGLSNEMPQDLCISYYNIAFVNSER